MYYLPQEAANRSHDLRMAVAVESNLLGRLSLEQRKKKQVKLAMADYARQIHQFLLQLKSTDVIVETPFSSLIKTASLVLILLERNGGKF